jgi:hypothetical protein
MRIGAKAAIYSLLWLSLNTLLPRFWNWQVRRVLSSLEPHALTCLVKKPMRRRICVSSVSRLVIYNVRFGEMRSLTYSLKGRSLQWRQAVHS